MRKGDELWEFGDKSPRGDRLHGVKLLRNGIVIDWIVAEVTPPKGVDPMQPMFGVTTPRKKQTGETKKKQRNLQARKSKRKRRV
jgi:hypothetical protein